MLFTIHVAPARSVDMLGYISTKNKIFKVGLLKLYNPSSFALQIVQLIAPDERNRGFCLFLLERRL